MVNFLALLGWALDDKTEIFSKEQLFHHFTVERVGQTAAIFNREKLDWMNGVYIRALTPNEFTARVLPFLEKGLPPEIERPVDINYLRRIAPLIRERIVTLKDAAGYADFFFRDLLAYDAATLTGKKTAPENARTALEAAEARLAPLGSFRHDVLEETLRRLADELGIKAGELLNLLRVATTGRDAAPPLFETMEVLGKERCLNRIKAALAILPSSGPEKG
jgi:glutamyl-tRNA synthetase